MNKYSYLVMLMMVVACASGNDRIRDALDFVMEDNFHANGDAVNAVDECGLSISLLQSASFSNLVAVVRSEIDNCPVSFLRGMTNRVPRTVFIEAAIRCGQETYRGAVTNWYGDVVAPAMSPELMEEFVVPTRTSMEGYFIERYEEPGISNVWINIKARYMASGDAAGASRIEHVLSGRVKAERGLMESLEAR